MATFRCICFSLLLLVLWNTNKAQRITVPDSVYLPYLEAFEAELTFKDSLCKHELRHLRTHLDTGKLGWVVYGLDRAKAAIEIVAKEAGLQPIFFVPSHFSLDDGREDCYWEAMQKIGFLYKGEAFFDSLYAKADSIYLEGVRIDTTKIYSHFELEVFAGPAFEGPMELPRFRVAVDSTLLPLDYSEGIFGTAEILIERNGYFSIERLGMNYGAKANAQLLDSLEVLVRQELNYSQPWQPGQIGGFVVRSRTILFIKVVRKEEEEY